MLVIDDLTYRIGPRVLLDGATAAIDAGHRVGLVGRNGTGKTTLLRLIAGSLEADGGSIRVPPRWRVGMTRQDAPEGARSLLDTVLAADTELSALQAEAETASDPARIAEVHARLQDREAHSAPARAARILAGLGFSEADQQRPCSDFSGGWRMRVALAGLLFTRPDLLLLDEPTNHLDLEAALWLESYLQRYPGTILLVSHDRGLLNRAVGEILHLENGRLTLYQGGYDRFERTRRERLILNDKLRARQEVRRAQIQAFVDRFRYKASKARQAQSRLKMLEKMEPIVDERDNGGMTFDFPDPDPMPPPLFTMDEVSIGYNGHPVLRKLDLRLDADDRIALLGANGQGKSTLIKLIAGKLSPLGGQFRRSGKLRVGYFAQHQTDELDLSATPLAALAERRPKETEEQVRSQLGRFGFSQERADTRIGNLSGGEKARLLFALCTSHRPHVLLLDEPTNHLDIQARDALVEAINRFQGAVILVSHDPHVIDLTVDRFWLCEKGRVLPFDGDLDDYRKLLLNGADGRAKARTPAARPADAGPDRREQRRQAAERRQALAPLRKRIGDAEAAIERLTAEKQRLTARMADPALYAGDPAPLVELRVRLGEVEKALAAAEEDWLARHDELEQAEAEAT